jgi:hypothetical protein
MSDSAPQIRKPAAPRDDDPPAAGEGRWGMDLWSGHTWFSDWFYTRLGWPPEAERRKLSDLRPSLPEGAWESLLLAIRDHLERQMPLDMRLRAQLPDGRIEYWNVQGLAERNAAGQPVYLAGKVRDVP